MTSRLSQNFIRMIRADFITLLRNEGFCASFPLSVECRLWRDLADLGGMLGEW